MSELRRITQGRVVRAGGGDSLRQIPTDGRNSVVEPTDEERKNGWDADSLARYQAERLKAQSMFILNEINPATGRPARERKLTAANSRYNPFRWRG